MTATLLAALLSVAPSSAAPPRLAAERAAVMKQARGSADGLHALAWRVKACAAAAAADGPDPEPYEALAKAARDGAAETEALLDRYWRLTDAYEAAKGLVAVDAALRGKEGAAPMVTELLTSMEKEDFAQLLRGRIDEVRQLVEVADAARASREGRRRARSRRDAAAAAAGAAAALACAGLYAWASRP